MAKTKTNGTAVSAKLRPLGDRVVVKPLGREEMTKCGIVIPDTAKEKPQRGTVIAAGAGRRDDDGDRIPLDVQVGDQVLFAKYAGTEFKLEDDELLILAEKDILADRRQSVARLARFSASIRQKEVPPWPRLLEFKPRPRAVAQGGCRHPGQRRQDHARPEGPQRRAR